MNLNSGKNLLMVSLAAETYFASYGLLLGKQTAVVSILYLLAGLVFFFSIMMLPAARLPGLYKLKKEAIWKTPFLLTMMVLAFITSRYWIERIPLDPDFADMLPVMKVMNERFLHGNLKQVYDPIPEIWHGIQPIYLPAMWLPYGPAIACQADMRWVTVCLVLVSFIVILSLIQLKGNKYYGYGLLVITAFLFWWIFARNDVHSLISMSEEGVVIFYFILLTLAIISGNPFFMGITASLCLFSRYSMIGWLIPCLLLFIAHRDYRKAIIFSVTCIFCFLFLFLIPFGFKTLDLMIALPGKYIGFANHVWEYSAEVYWLNLGLAKFFGPNRMGALHKILLMVSFGIPFIFMCFVLLQKKWKLHNVNLACFKLSLLVFYQFIDVPYGYLFYTCSFVSLVIAVSLLTQVHTGFSVHSSSI